MPGASQLNEHDKELSNLSMAFFRKITAHVEHVAEMEAYLKFANSEPLVTAEDETTAIDTAREEFEAIGMSDGMLGELLSGIEAYEVLNSEGTVIRWKISSL